MPKHATPNETQGLDGVSESKPSTPLACGHLFSFGIAELKFASRSDADGGEIVGSCKRVCGKTVFNTDFKSMKS
jgi:hypothetical protein